MTDRTIKVMTAHVITDALVDTSKSDVLKHLVAPPAQAQPAAAGMLHAYLAMAWRGGQVVAAWDSGSGCAVEVPAWHLLPGRYLLQLSLAGPVLAALLGLLPRGAAPLPTLEGSAAAVASKAALAVTPGSMQGDAEHAADVTDGEGSSGPAVAWRMCVAPAADAKACSVVEDDSRLRYFQVKPPGLTPIRSCSQAWVSLDVGGSCKRVFCWSGLCLHY